MIRRTVPNAVLCAVLEFSNIAAGQSGQGGGRPPAQTDARVETEDTDAESAADESNPTTLATQSASKRAPLAREIIIWFHSDSSSEQIASKPASGPVRIELLSGRRRYGEATVQTPEDWITATATGLRIALKRQIPIDQLNQLTLSISFRGEPPETWLNTQISVSVVSVNDVETMLNDFPIPADPELPSPRKWPMPRLDKPAKTSGQELKSLHIQLDQQSAKSLSPEVSVMTLEVLWGNAIIQSVTLDDPDQWDIACNEGILIETRRAIYEKITQELQLRAYVRQHGRPIEFGELSKLKLTVTGIATDNLKTVLSPRNSGELLGELLDQMIAKMQAGIHSSPKADHESQQEQLAELEAQLDSLADSPDKRLHGRYWNFQKIVP